MQASVGSHCLDCAKAAKPDVKDRAKLWNARQPTLVTYVLIAINVAVFLLTTISDTGTLLSGNVSEMQARLGLSRQVLETGGCISRTVCFEPDQWYRLVTSGFLHFGIFHIAFNMILLFQLGQILEPRLGRTRFALLYFASLLAGSLGVVITDSIGIAGGASGAVFGLMTAAAIGMWRQGINIFSTGIGTLLILNLVLTFTVSGIAVGGHVGGAVAGALCGLAMLAPRWKPTPEWSTYVVPIVIGVGSVVASIVIVSAG